MSSSNHHPTFYFPDGDLIITCRSNEGTPTYFRVHPTVIAKHSAIFTDMLTTPFPPDNQDVYDGVSFVRFPDPEGMATFFYEPFTLLSSDRDTDTDIAFTISGVLKVADRLMVEPLKQAILSRARLDWPSTLEEWDARQAFCLEAGKHTYPDPAPVIELLVCMIQAFGLVGKRMVEKIGVGRSWDEIFGANCDRLIIDSELIRPD